MPSKSSGSTSVRRLRAVVRRVVTLNNLVMLVAGIVAGYSIAVVGTDGVSVPVLGQVPGPVVGVVGLVVALGVYRQGSCCDDCGDRSCSCETACGDSCSYDP